MRRRPGIPQGGPVSRRADPIELFRNFSFLNNSSKTGYRTSPFSLRFSKEVSIFRKKIIDDG
jgi:hypothetical protein